jgi:hypothetical protein
LNSILLIKLTLFLPEPGTTKRRWLRLRHKAMFLALIIPQMETLAKTGNFQQAQRRLTWTFDEKSAKIFS